MIRNIKGDSSNAENSLSVNRKERNANGMPQAFGADGGGELVDMPEQGGSLYLIHASRDCS